MANAFLQEKCKSLKITKSSHKKKKGTDTTEGLRIDVDPLSNKPTEAWERLERLHRKQELPLDMYLMTPLQDTMLRFVCLSDTHGTVEHSRREFHNRVPDGDVLIHCGDFSMGGDPSEVMAFDSFIGKLPHPVKLVIAGNHELTFEDVSYGVHPHLVRQKLGLPLSASGQEVIAGCKALLQHMLYLEDEAVSICGINIYGSPWVPEFGSWGFSAKRGENLLEKWNQIPSDTNILITHGPPCGYGDDVGNGKKRAGCVELLNTVVKRVKPRFHVFGHIHSGYGMWTNGTTTFINSAVCTNTYRPSRDPIVFDYPLPRGYSRHDFAQVTTDSLRQTREEARKRHSLSNGHAREMRENSDTKSTDMDSGKSEVVSQETEEGSSSVQNGSARSRYEENPAERSSEAESDDSRLAAQMNGDAGRLCDGMVHDTPV